MAMQSPRKRWVFTLAGSNPVSSAERRLKNMKKTNKKLSAGGIVFKKKGREVYWLIVKPKKSKKWCLPKGYLSGAESTVAAAKREVREEAGIENQLLEKVGEKKDFFYQDKQKIPETVVFYLMEYLADTEESFNGETDKIVWLPLKKALTRLVFDKEKELLKEAVDLLKQLEKQQKE